MAEILACLFSCNLERLRILLKPSSVNIEIPGTEGCTTLHLLVGIDTVNSKENMLAYLLENGADPNARSYENLTPVHIASMWNKRYELEKLLQFGGNPWLTDIDNKNSFDMAADHNCYEVYQLLNIYLAEDKLNFKSERQRFSQELHINSTPLNSTKLLRDPETEGKNTTDYYATPLSNIKSFRDPEAEDKNTTAYYSYMTANENFPLIFSSTEEESEDYSSDVSRFLKRKSFSKSTYKNVTKRENNTSNALPREQDESTEKTDSDALTDEAKDQKQVYPNCNKVYLFSSTDCDSSEISNSDLNDSVDSTYGSTVINSDHNNGISLIEVKTDDNDMLSSNVSTCSVGNDWKSYQSANSNCSALTYCSSHSKLCIIIPEELNDYSNSKIFQELKNLDDDPGPVIDQTRKVYLQRLAQLKSGCITSCELPKPKYCPEVYLFLENKMDMERADYLERSMAQEFDVESEKKWREGNQRTCFNYFLLDPRVTQNLPRRASHLTNEQAFLTFLDALFYVGKGTRGRPHSHLIEAIQSVKNGRPKSDKVTHILDIWDAGFGVVSIHVFHNSIPVEAYTREACIIEAVGLNNLTNIKKGDFYGLCAKLTSPRKRLIGISLLNRAFKIYKLEGERQIKCQDIQHQ